MAQTENPGRERILGRIKMALKTPDKSRCAGACRARRSPIFAPIPDALERFRRECAGNNTELIVTEDARATGAALEAVLASLPEERYLCRMRRSCAQISPALDDRKIFVGRAKAVRTRIRRRRLLWRKCWSPRPGR